jgi:hypothetical protein
MKKLIATLLLAAPLAFADDAPRKPFPDDYTATTCPTVSCESYHESELVSAASAFYAFTLDAKWVQENLPKIQTDLAKNCAKVTSCFATASNTKMFCLDLLAPEFRTVCTRMYPKDTMPRDHELCLETVETWLLGLDQRMQPRYLATRECAMQQPDTRTNKTLDVWMKPADILPAAPETDITIYAIDHDTHVPVLGSISVEGQIIYAPSNPTGALATDYHFKWPLKYSRITNAEGREEAVGPLVTVNAEGYPPVSFRMKVEVPAVVVSAEPKLSSLRAGRKSTLTVNVIDAKTGQAVDGRVMLGKTPIGTTNAPFKFTPKKGAEIWLSNLSNGASDVVVKD